MSSLKPIHNWCSPCKLQASLHQLSGVKPSLGFFLMFTAGFLWGLFMAHGEAGMMSSVLSPEEITFLTSIQCSFHVSDAPAQ